MFDRKPKLTRSTACNDNGLAVMLGGRAVAPRGVLTAAARACELVLLSYVAQGSMIVMQAGRRPVATAA
jgi:hypothetical protein